MASTATGTVAAPRVYEGPSRSDDDAVVNSRLFSYDTDSGLVTGYEISVQFTLNGTASEVWPYMKEWNAWQNPYGYFYNGVVGDLYNDETLDLGTETFRITVRNPDVLEMLNLPSDGEWTTDEYVVLRVVPERAFVIFQPVDPEKNGGISGGIHTFVLTEKDGKTIVTGNMEHASRTTDQAEEDTLEFWRTGATEVCRFWRDIFIPNLQKLVDERN
jgi:hypothetical protein